jgi:Flp pilus assembly protein TadB
VSRERARRREQRAHDEALRRTAHEREQARVARRRATRAAVTERVPRRIRWRGQQGLLARRRRTQNGVIACLVLASQLIVWLLTADPYARAIAAVLAIVITPVLITLTFDRRS